MRSAAMHIAFAANETYAVGLAAAVQSVVESLHRCNRPADIWILDFGLREQSSRWLLRIQDMLSHPQQDSSSGSNSGTAVDPAQIKLHIVAPTTQGPAGQLLSQLPPAMGYASSVTWSKLFLPDLLPSAAADNHGLLLYLDSDVIVTPGTDLRQLWDNWLKVSSEPLKTSKKQHVIAAVRDFGSPCGHAGLRALGWGKDFPDDPSAAKYFNAGVLLLHVPSFRERILPRIMQALGRDSSSSNGSSSSSGSSSRHDDLCRSRNSSSVQNAREGFTLTGKFPYADQDVLNIVVEAEGCWLELSPEWNVQGIDSYLMDRCLDHGPDKPALFTREQAADVEAHPAIIHFTGTPKPKPSELLNPWVKVPTKPWAFVSTHPHRQLFYQFLNKTHWQGTRAQQVDLESATVDELSQLADWVDKYCTTEATHGSSVRSSSSSSTFNRARFFRSVGQQLLQGAEVPAAHTSTVLLAAIDDPDNNLHPVTDDQLHPVFRAFRDPENPNLTLAGHRLDPEAGFRFTDVWFDPHAPSWQSNVIPHLLPEGIDSKPVRVLEIGLWEGRSTCYILLQIASHPESKVVCVDPFDKLYPVFRRNRVAWLRNVAAAGGLGTAAAMLVRAAAAAPPPWWWPPPRPELATAMPAAAATTTTFAQSADIGGFVLEAPDLPDNTVQALHSAALVGTYKVQLLHEASAAALPKMLLSAESKQHVTVDSSSGSSSGVHRSGGAQSAAPAALQIDTGPLFDLVYIDGSHMRVDVLVDAVLAWPLLQPGGLMVFDDYEWDRYRDNMVCHPKEGIDAFLGVHAHQLDVIHKGYQVIVKKKTADE